MTHALKLDVPDGSVGMSISGASNGQIVFAGGRPQCGILKSELFILDTNRLRWVHGGHLRIPRAGHTATLLDGDKILFVGGDHLSAFFEIQTLITAQNATAINPALKDGVSLSSMIEPPVSGRLKTVRFGHSATKLNDGRVLIAGGFTKGLLAAKERDDLTSSAEIFDPETLDTVEASAMVQSRGYHAATLLNDGRVMISGGLSGNDPLNGIEFYDPTSQTFHKTRGLRMRVGRFFHTTTLLPDGQILIAEIFGPIRSEIVSLPDLNEARGGHSANLLDRRWVLLAGGSERYSGGLSSQEDLNGKSLQSTEVFDIFKHTFVMTASLKTAGDFINPSSRQMAGQKCRQKLEDVGYFSALEWGR